VYRFDGAWAVKKEGGPVRTFSTQRKAVDAARKSLKGVRVGQLVVHGRDGRIRKCVTRGMPRVQDPPRKSRLAGPIGRAVAKIVLARVIGPPPPA